MEMNRTIGASKQDIASRMIRVIAGEDTAVDGSDGMGLYGMLAGYLPYRRLLLKLPVRYGDGCGIAAVSPRNKFSDNLHYKNGPPVLDLVTIPILHEVGATWLLPLELYAVGTHTGKELMDPEQHPLAEWLPETWKDLRRRLCSQCYSQAREKYEAVEEEIWDELLENCALEAGAASFLLKQFPLGFNCKFNQNSICLEAVRKPSSKCRVFYDTSLPIHGHRVHAQSAPKRWSIRLCPPLSHRHLSLSALIQNGIETSPTYQGPGSTP
ncbi:hypothetical protein B0H14DRAFT_2635172 [Mycena olivaceomarginata]|nr:hypothetical protein B0H14DRAFT_2635172 [Mycena olivaceomarginata]